MREPYVGAGADGARRSAQIDREEVDGLDPTNPRWDELLASAAAWEMQADQLEREAAVDAHGAYLNGADPEPVAGPVYTDAGDASDYELTPRELAARRLLLLASWKKLLEEEAAAARKAEGATFTKGGQREVAELPDGTPLGNVRLDPAKGSWAVTDPDALLEYVEEVHADQVYSRTTYHVAEAWTAEMLKSVTAGKFEVVNLETGDTAPGAPPGVTYSPGATKLVVTPSKEAPAALRRYLGALAAHVSPVKELDQ